MREVVVTGLGVMSSLGFNKETFIENLLNGKNGISDVSLFDTNDYRTNKAGEIKNPEKHPCYDTAIPDDRILRLIYAAVSQAIEDSKVKSRDDFEEQTTMWIGTTAGTINSLKNYCIDYWDNSLISEKYLKTFYWKEITDIISNYIGIKGLSRVLGTVCASGTHSIGMGTFLIRSGISNIAVVGGGEALNESLFAGFDSLRSISNIGICSPFSKNRTGLIVGEGAGILILEDKETAYKRNAHIYAKVKGIGISCDAKHIAIPDANGEGVYLGLKQAMEDAKLDK